jgi:hypothetical protein
MVRKRKGAGKLGRTEKNRNSKKKKGSRRGGENRKVSEW